LAWDRDQRATEPGKVRARAREQYHKHKSRVLQEVERYQEANREKICDRKRHKYHSQSPEERWRVHLMVRYGITPDDYDRMHREQGGVCAICKTAGIRKRLNVDHCHRTKKVRGLLCDNCNHGLGKFKDDVELLAVAQQYLSGR
jgi:hypothetical protein